MKKAGEKDVREEGEEEGEGDLRYWHHRAKELEREVSRLEAALKREREHRREWYGDEKRRHGKAGRQLSEEDVYERARAVVAELLPLENELEADVALDALFKGYTTHKDLADVRDMCWKVNALRWEHIYKSFFQVVVDTRSRQSEELRRRDANLAEDWYREPWYSVYVQSFGTKKTNKSEGRAVATFDDLCEMLPYLEKLGIRNILLHTHYESPLGDCGFDVSGYGPRESLGGTDGYRRFMRAALTGGFHIATDAIVDQTSTEHPWFQMALDGCAQHLEYYVQVNGREKIDESVRGDELFCIYRDPDGRLSELVCNFPNVDRTHGLWTTIHGKTYQFFRSLYPFQVDLNLRNPYLLEEFFHLLADEVIDGILGKRMCSVGQWQKSSGSSSDNQSDVHALLALFKSLLRHLSSRTIVLTDAVHSSSTTAPFAGIPTAISSVRCPSEGDLLAASDMHSALLQMVCLENIAPFWRTLFQVPTLTSGANWLNYLEHSEELVLNVNPPEMKEKMNKYLVEHGLVLYKNGQSCGGRIANCLDDVAERIATAIFCLYMAPGIPQIYFGLEVGARTDRAFAEEEKWKRQETWKSLGCKASVDACYDPRDLHRAPISKAVFDASVDSHYPVVKLLSKMNDLRREYSALREDKVSQNMPSKGFSELSLQEHGANRAGKVQRVPLHRMPSHKMPSHKMPSHKIHPVDSGHLSLLCLVRASRDGSLLCCANLSGQTKICCLPAWQVASHLHLGSGSTLTTIDLLTEEVVLLQRTEKGFVVELKPNARCILDCSFSSEGAGGADSTTIMESCRPPVVSNVNAGPVDRGSVV